MPAEQNPFADWGARPSDPAPAVDAPAARSRPPRQAVLGGALVAAAAVAAVLALGVFSSGTPARAPVTAASHGGRPTGASAPMSVASFRSQFDAACTTGSDSIKALGQVNQSNYAHWTEQFAQITQQVLARIEALTPPASLATGDRALLATLEGGLDQLRHIESVAQSGGFAHFEQAAKAAAPPAALQKDQNVADRYGLDCEPVAQADAGAKELAHTAQVTIETYATDNNGSYAGATLAKLRSYETTLQTAPGNSNAYLSGVTVLDGGKGYVLTAASVMGDSFSITRSPSGALSRSCTSAPGNPTGPLDCSAAHTW